MEETLAAQARDAIGRDHYEHGAAPGPGYRNGCRPGRLKTAEGVIDDSAPQVAGKSEPYRSAIREHRKGQTQALEDLAIELLARGLSVRDIEDAFRDLPVRRWHRRTAASGAATRAGTGGLGANGAKVLLHLMAGSKEGAETVTAFSQDMRAWGLGDPLLRLPRGARHRQSTGDVLPALRAPALSGPSDA